MADTTKFHKDARIVRYLQKIGFYPPTFVTFVERVQSHVQNNGRHHPKLTVYIDNLEAVGDLATEKGIEHLLFLLFGEIALHFPQRLALDGNSEFYFNRQLRLEEIIAQRLDHFKFTREQYDRLEAFVWDWCRNQTPFRSLGQFRKAWMSFNSEGEFGQHDLQIFGDLSYLMQQGPHCALFAVDEARSDASKKYCLLQPTENFPQEGRVIADSNFGFIFQMEGNDGFMACKKIDLSRVRYNKRRSMRLKDNPQNEIPTHQYIEYSHHTDTPNTPEKCPYIVSYYGAAKQQEGKKEFLMYYMEFGHDYFTKLTTSFRGYVKQWRSTLKTQCRGRSWTEYRRLNQSPWERERGKEWLMQLAATHYLHQMGIAHRDIKLENLICDDQGRTKVIDFGVAYRFGMWEREEMKCRDSVGTAQYMSPECFFAGSKRKFNESRLHIAGDGTCYSARANDVWCLGVMLFCALCQDYPYREISASDPSFVWLTQGKYLPPGHDHQIRSMEHLLKQRKKLLMITDSVIDLMSKIFVPENERITLGEIFDHEWLQDIKLETGIGAVQNETLMTRQDFQTRAQQRAGYSVNVEDSHGNQIELIHTYKGWIYILNGVPRVADASLHYEDNKSLARGKSLGAWGKEQTINISPNFLREKIEELEAIRLNNKSIEVNNTSDDIALNCADSDDAALGCGLESRSFAPDQALALLAPVS